MIASSISHKLDLPQSVLTGNCSLCISVQFTWSTASRIFHTWINLPSNPVWIWRENPKSDKFLITLENVPIYEQFRHAHCTDYPWQVVTISPDYDRHVIFIGICCEVSRTQWTRKLVYINWTDVPAVSSSIHESDNCVRDNLLCGICDLTAYRCEIIVTCCMVAMGRCMSNIYHSSYIL